MITEHAEKNCTWQKNVLLAPFSTYKIGGPASYFTKVSTNQQLEDALRFCYQEQIAYYILGKGSNTLFDDRGFDGAVIQNAISGFEMSGNEIRASAGTSFSYLGLQSAKAGLGGLEFAAGIPGSVGGAIFMNAGANSQEVAHVATSVDFMGDLGEIKTFTKEELHFGYRKSIFHELTGVIVSASFQLYPDANARDRQIEIINKRKLSQPLQEPSCGCVFRNGADFITGKLIEQLGLKGKQIGGAQISELHANFIVNKGGATAQDVKDLIELIEAKVKGETSYCLEREIRFVPYRRDV